MKIIDFHVHPFLNPSDSICGYDAGLTTEAFVSRLKDAGINKFCGSVIKNRYKNETPSEIVLDLNREALEFYKLYKDCYIPGMHIDPRCPDTSCEQIDDMKAFGFKLIGELVPYAYGWEFYKSNNLYDILKYACEKKMIVSYHLLDKDIMIPFISEFKDLIFIAAHPGEKPVYDNTLNQMMKFENLYLDLSGTGLFRYGMLKYGIEKVGSERLLFGSDFPTCNPAMNISAVMYEQIKDRDRENIFYKNAEKLLGIE